MGVYEEEEPQRDVAGNTSWIWVVDFIQFGIKNASPSIDSSFRSI